LCSHTSDRTGNSGFKLHVFGSLVILVLGFLFSVGEIITMLDLFCKSKMKDLELIIKFKMNEMEAKAYKIALIWQEECKRELPGEQFAKLRKNSDPRKSTLFKYCYKLAKETKGILKEEDINLYIRAQIQILKSIREGEIHALIEPHCLVGEKAWKRWKFWKYRFRKVIGKIPTSDEAGVSSNNSKIITEMNSDFDFLKRMDCLNFVNIKSKKEEIKRWLSCGQLSFYYATLSPWIKLIFKNEELDFDRTYYRSCTNPQIDKFFKDKFAHEF